MKPDFELWQIQCNELFQVNLSNHAPSTGVLPMVESCADLIKDRLVRSDEVFSQAGTFNVRSASAAELASQLFAAWSNEIWAALISSTSSGPARSMDVDLVSLATETYGTLLGRLAEWSICQFELMLPQSEQNDILIPWKSIIDLSLESKCDPGMLTCMILMESITSSILLNDALYSETCKKLWDRALVLDSVDVDKLLEEVFENDLHDHVGFKPDSVPHRVKDPKALVETFSDSQRTAALANLDKLTNEAAASVRVIVQFVARQLFGPEALHLQHLLDQYRIDVPDFAHLLRAAFGTSVCINPWTQVLAKYEQIIESDGSAGVIGSLHMTAARLAQE